jgi:carboxymethylenebutenolidase
MSHTTRTQEIHVDGGKMNLYIAAPKNISGKLPAILVLQEAFGVDRHIQEVTKRFADEGFLAVAPELFHRTARGFIGSYDDFTAIMPHYQAVTVDTLKADFKATYGWLTENGADANQVVAIGFCMGGRAAFVANATLPLKAAISYYGGGIAPDLLPLAKEQHGPFLMCWGGLDGHIPVEQSHQIAAALKTAKKSYLNIEFSDGDHGFFNDHKKQYNKKVASEAWALSLQFLKNNLG